MSAKLIDTPQIVEMRGQKALMLGEDVPKGLVLILLLTKDKLGNLSPTTNASWTSKSAISQPPSPTPDTLDA